MTPGEYRYVRSLGSPCLGHEIMTVMRSTAKWQNRSLWLCLYPDGAVRIVSMIGAGYLARRVQREPGTTTVYDSAGLRAGRLVWDDAPRPEADIVKAFDADKLNEQREPRRHVDKLQDELTASRSPTDEAAGGVTAPAATAPMKNGPEAYMVAELLEMWGSLGKVVEDEIGRLDAAPAGVPPVGVGPLAGTVTPTGAAAPGTPTLSVPVTKALAAMPKVVESAEESSIDGIVVRLKRGTQATVYQNSTAVQYAKQWLRDHLLIKCVPKREMISIMEAVGDSIIHDERDVINRVASERLIWRAYGLERCYEEVAHEIDWKRPDGKKGCVPKCKWDLCDRYYTHGANFRSSRVPEADEEAKQAVERDTSLQKWYTKSAANWAADAD